MYINGLNILIVFVCLIHFIITAQQLASITWLIFVVYNERREFPPSLLTLNLVKKRERLQASGIFPCKRWW